jgi:hypothetical protein
LAREDHEVVEIHGAGAFDGTQIGDGNRDSLLHNMREINFSKIKVNSWILQMRLISGRKRRERGSSMIIVAKGMLTIMLKSTAKECEKSGVMN